MNTMPHTTGSPSLTALQRSDLTRAAAYLRCRQGHDTLTAMEAERIATVLQRLAEGAPTPASEGVPVDDGCTEPSCTACRGARAADGSLK